MDPIAGICGGALGTIALFGGIALLIWVNAKSELPKRQFEAAERERQHALRLKALELGRPLPDAEVARYHAESSRAWAAGVVALVVPLAMAGCAVGATALILTLAWVVHQVVLIIVVWAIAGVVSLTTVAIALGSLAGRAKAERHERNYAATADARGVPDLSAAIQE